MNFTYLFPTHELSIAPAHNQMWSSLNLLVDQKQLKTQEPRTGTIASHSQCLTLPVHYQDWQVIFKMPEVLWPAILFDKHGLLFLIQKVSK